MGHLVRQAMIKAELLQDSIDALSRLSGGDVSIEVIPASTPTTATHRRKGVLLPRLGAQLRHTLVVGVRRVSLPRANQLDRWDLARSNEPSDLIRVYVPHVVGRALQRLIVFSHVVSVLISHSRQPVFEAPRGVLRCQS